VEAGKHFFQTSGPATSNDLLGGGYSYDSTSIRLQFNRATTNRRQSLQP